MTPDVVRRLILTHGIVAWLDALFLVAVAILFFRKHGPDKPFFRRLATIATLGGIVAFASGLALEMHYRFHVRQRLFVASKSLGWLFERKMHLSLGALLFAMIGLVTILLMREEPRFVRASRIAYVLAAVFAIVACVISSVVGIAKPFVD